MLYQCKWNFSNLEDALEEGGELFDKTVFLFACTEPHFVYFQGRHKVILKPIVVAVASPFPPSDKMAIASVQKGEEIIPMKHMKFDWLPYIPPEKRF
ncbi:Protein HEAT INTOLERANT 4 [Orobanche hederae]